MLGHMNARERTILWHTCFGHFLSHFNMLAFPALVIPLTGLLGLDMAAVLGLSFWMYLLYGLMGRWAARAGGAAGPGLALGLILAWALGVSFPLFAG